MTTISVKGNAHGMTTTRSAIKNTRPQQQIQNKKETWAEWESKRLARYNSDAAYRREWNLVMGRLNAQKIQNERDGVDTYQPASSRPERSLGIQLPVDLDLDLDLPRSRRLRSSPRSLLQSKRI